MRNIASSFLGIAFACIATNASAIDVDLGTIPSTGTFEVVTFSNLVENDTSDPAGTPFVDEYTFTIEQPNAITDISINRLPLQQSGLDVLLFDPFTTTLFNGGLRATLDRDGQTEDLLLDPGEYTIRIEGNAVGLAGGFYSGAVVVSAIPIPAAGLLFFSAIAALGLIRSKRASA